METHDVVKGEVLPAENGNGHHPAYASVDEILADASKDIVERDVTGVFGDKTIRVRGLTAAQSAAVKQSSFNMKGKAPEVAWAAMERAQFEMGVIAPKFTSQQVLMLHRMAGPSFAKVIEVLDEISGIGKETLREAQLEFQEQGE